MGLQKEEVVEPQGRRRGATADGTTTNITLATTVVSTPVSTLHSNLTPTVPTSTFPFVFVFFPFWSLTPISFVSQYYFIYYFMFHYFSSGTIAQQRWSRFSGAILLNRSRTFCIWSHCSTDREQIASGAIAQQIENKLHLEPLLNRSRKFLYSEPCCSIELEKDLRSEPYCSIEQGKCLSKCFICHKHIW